MGRMLGQRANAGQFFVGREPVPVDAESAAGDLKGVDESVDFESTLEPRTAPPRRGFPLAHDGAAHTLSSSIALPVYNAATAEPIVT